MFEARFRVWLVPLALLPLASLRIPLASRLLASRAAIYLLCCLLAFLIVISAAVSKLPWYVAPAYPLIAVLAALGVYQLRLLFGENGRVRTGGAIGCDAARPDRHPAATLANGKGDRHDFPVGRATFADLPSP